MKGLIAGPAAILAILYAGGYLAQFIGNYAVWKQGGGIPGDGTSPVSYTHLDVYKRQSLSCSGWFDCI